MPWSRELSLRTRRCWYKLRFPRGHVTSRWNEGPPSELPNTFTPRRDWEQFTAWAGHCCGIRVDRQLLAQADERIRPWRTSVVHPLRQARRDMKQDSLAQFHAGAAALRQRVKDLELQAERLQLEHLEGFLLAGRARGQPGAPLARLNLAELLAWAGAPDEPHLQHLLTALRAV